jgi:hypothetical protein
MKKVWNCGLAACLALFMSSAVVGQEYTFTIDGPDSFTGGAGSEHSADYTVNLGHSGAGIGAQGWSLGVEVTGGVATSATTAGTNVDDVFSGGFNKTSVIDPANNGGKEGAVSAIVLCFGCPAVLPPNAVSSILTVGTTFAIPAGGGAGSLNVVDGLVGEGQPVDVVVTEAGASKEFAVVPKEVALNEEVTCCGAAYNVGFSTDSLNNDVSGEGLIDDSETCNAVGSIEAGGETTVYANIASAAEAGVQGWSVSIEVTGGADITAVTTDGTQAAPAPDGKFNGGFNKTSIANAEASGGRRGAVSAIVLCFGCPATLKPTGTESILAMTVTAPAVGESGDIFFADGLVGEGQPVDNVVTVEGGSADVCNIDVARVTIVGAEGGASFSRGDCNSDAVYDIADPVWTLNEQFREGPASTCQAACDVNGDGVVDLADATYGIAYLFEGGAAPPDPFGECGTVEDTGDLTCEESACP